MADSILLAFELNGEHVEVATPPHYTLLEVLRYKLDLVGTKQGCDKGDCGACTVQIDDRAVLSCLCLALHAQGRRIKTVEGFTRTGLHVLQDCFDRQVAAQCGFCTPGILMAAEAYLAAVGKRGARTVSRQEVAEALASNLCRCTGYTKIVDAIVEASEILTTQAPTDATEPESRRPDDSMPGPGGQIHG